MGPDPRGTELKRNSGDAGMPFQLLEQLSAFLGPACEFDLTWHLEAYSQTISQEHQSEVWTLLSSILTLNRTNAPPKRELGDGAAMQGTDPPQLKQMSCPKGPVEDSDGRH